MRRLIWLLAILVVIYGAGEFAAKSYAEDKIEEQVKDKYSLAREVDASVSVPLIFGLITGSAIDRVEVAVDHFDAGEFLTDRVTAVLTRVHIDAGESIRRRELVVDSVERLDVTIEISDDEASKSLPQGLAFRFESGKVSLEGAAVSVDGKFEVAGNDVRFVPEQTPALPREFQAPVWKLGSLPLVTCLRDIEVLSGLVRITCSTDNPPAEFPPSRS